MSENPLIVALDVESAGEARRLVDALNGTVDFFKVGMELYASAGMEFARELKGGGKRVFLDMKFYDIGETVKRAVAQVARSGVDFLTVHGSAADLADLGYPCDVSDLVDLRVRKAVECGIDGIVCSPVEAARVRSLAGPRTILVTPGVRSAEASKGDQKRVATPAKAIRDGADFLVIGRQVTRAAEPAAEARRILAEIYSAA
jgi:orotidine-5'-phosphate decarboxylase